MALQLILGNSGSGKSHDIFEKIIEESIRCPQKQFLVIVPEQFTMQTQKDLTMMHPRRGIMNIDVLSFERLAHRVFAEVGGEQRRILEDTGKNLILRRLAEEKKDELTILGGNLKKLGYISEVKSLISEFTQYRVEPRQLEQMMEQNRDNPQLYYKLKDMKLIYESFREYLADTYLTAEELLEALEKTVGDSACVRGSVIVLDGYTGFTPVQMNLLKKLLTVAETVYITLTADVSEDFRGPGAEYELFYLTKKTVRGLKDLAAEAKAEVLKPVLKKDAGICRYRGAPALHFLESQIFRHGNRFWDQPTDEIALFAARGPRAESEEIGRQILRLVRDEGLRYRDIAVVTGNLEVYGTLLEQVFASYGIPGFIDRKKDVLKNPFVEFLRALLAVFEEDFSYESMFRFLRSGMTNVTMDETDRLENYVIARGVRGFSGWNREWKRPLKGMEEEELAGLNDLRRRVSGSLAALRERLRKKDADVQDLTRAVYDHLVSLEIQKQLKEYEKRFDAAGDYAAAREYAQIYGMVMGLFDKLVMLLGSVKMPLSEYAELLDAGLAEMKVGLVPAGTDQVLVGDMERSRLKDVKVLFFAGVNEGSVPREKSRGGILSEMDREILAKQQVELAPTSRQETYIQKFYMYLNLTKPSKRLCLSWSLADADGGALRPSCLIAQVQDLFPHIPVRTGSGQGLAERLTAPKAAVRELTESLTAARGQRAEAEQIALIQWYADQERWRKKLEGMLNAVFFTNEESGIGRAVARALYGTLLEGSVTRLEQFAACAYAHFLQYGLQLKERETFGLEAVDMGNVFHSALKYFSDAVEEGGYGWFHVPDEKRTQWMEEALTRAMDDYADRVFPDTSRAQDQYVLERIRRIGQRTAWAVLKQLERGAFFPDRTEVSFRELEQLASVSVLLSEDERMRLRGRIDRIDVCREGATTYVRVIDYKSGSTRFDLTSVYYGLQLQLVVYLNAAMETETRRQDGDVRPAGMFYYHIEDPMPEYDTEQEPEQEIFRRLGLTGLANADKQIVTRMDEKAEQSPDVLPLKFKKDGDFTASSSVAEEEQLLRLSRHVQRKLSEYGKRILAGDIRPEPYELGDEDACRYCPYHCVCGFDRRVEGCRKRRLRPLEKEEVWRKLEEEEG